MKIGVFNDILKLKSRIMKTNLFRFFLVCILVFTVLFSANVALSQDSLPIGKYKYAYSCDGFNQDRDDVAGSAMTLAIFDKLKMSKQLVHYHFNTNFGGAPKHAEDHCKSVLQTAVLFKIIKSENDTSDAFFDVSASEKEKQAAINHLAKQILKASKKEPLMIFCAGAVQLPYFALRKAIEMGASKENLSSLVYVSHSLFNEKAGRGDNPDNWTKLKTVTPLAHFIDYTSPIMNGRRDGGVNKTQNETGWNQAPRNQLKGIEEWKWIANYGKKVSGFGFTGTKGEWLLQRLKAAGAPELGKNGNAEGDASDAGMVFAVLPGGKTDATMDEIRMFFLGK